MARSAAFAEGRRQREASWRHRQAQQDLRRNAMQARRRLPVGVRVLLWLLAAPFLFMFFMSGVMLLAGLIFVTKGLFVLALPLVIGGAVALNRKGHRRAALRRGGAAGTAPLPARAPAPPRPDLVWNRARTRFHALRSAYAAYECDAMAVLRLPALADVSVPSTGRFVDAFAEAQALETDMFPPVGHSAAFVAAVERAERAWQAAREAAQRIRLSGLSLAERNTVERVIKLLTTARESDSDAERLAAYTRARSELAKLDRAGVVHVPVPATAALDTAAQAALSA